MARALTSPRPRALLATASIAVALAAADTYVVVLALTDMMAGVGLGLDGLQRAAPIISGFLLGYVAVLPLIGRLADLMPRQRVLLACLFIFVIGSVITALAVELPVLIAGRVIQGVGGGGLVPATLALVADLWSAQRRGTPLGVVGAVQELGSVLGPVLGALVLTVADWRAIFWVNAGLGLALAAVLWSLGSGAPVDGAVRDVARPRRQGGQGWQGRFGWGLTLLGLGVGTLALAAPEALVTSVSLGLPFVPFGEHTSRVLTPIAAIAIALLVAAVALTGSRWWPLLRRADLPGAVLLGTALGSVILTFSSADPEREVVGPLGFALLPLAALALAAYGWRHSRAAEPLIARGVVRGRGTYALIVSCLVGVALVAVVVDVPLFARLTVTTDETAAALILVRFLVAVPVGALVGGWSLRRLGDGLVAGLGLAFAAAGLIAMANWDALALKGFASTLALIMVGFGVGLALAPVNNAMLADSPAAAHGSASALVVVARMVGMVIGLALLTAIGLHRYYAAVAALPDPTDPATLKAAAVVQVHSVFGGAAIAAGVGAVASVGLGVKRRVSQ